MSANAAIFNPTESTSAATGDGFACPRMTTAGRLGITFTTLDRGMMVYDTTLNSLFIWNGSAWELIDGTGTSSNTQVLFNDNGAPAGDPTMVFDKNTDTLTVQNLVVTGSTTTLGGLDASSIRAAASDYAAVTFDGATASTRIASGCQAIGTGDFSLWSRFRVPATSGAQNFAVIGLSSANNTISVANGFRTLVDNLGAFLVQLYGATTSDSRTATISGFVTAYVGQVVDVVVTRSGSTLKIYINGTDTAYTETTAGTPPAWSATIASDFTIVGAAGTSSVTVFFGRIYRSVVFNRALNAGDVTELITLGVNPADQWGSQTAAYTSDFSAGTDSWTATNGTAAGNIDGIGGQDNNLRYTISSGANTADGLSRSSTVIPSKRYRLNFSYYIPSGQTQINTLRAFVGLASVVTGLNVTNAWTDVSAEGVVTGDTSLRVNQNFVGTGNGTDVFYIRAVTATRIGAIVDLDFTVGTGYQATDRSTNALHGTLFNGVSWTMPETSARLYATTAFLGNSQLLGSLSIPTNAMIEDIFVFVIGISTIEIGDVSGGNTIAGSQVAGAYTRLTLAGIRSSTGNLWVNSSNSNSMTFNIIYSIL
jgi:hypothetical protein